MPKEHKQPVTEDHSQAKTILVVEDDADIGEFLVQAILTETPYQALLAKDAFQALKVAHDVKPNLLIFDYQLPHMNGIELYDQFHAMKELEDIPALIISAGLPEKEIAKRHITGLHKPLELSDLLNSIEKLMAC